MSRKHKGSGGYKRAHKLGFTKVRYGTDGVQIIYNRAYPGMFLSRRGTQWRVSREHWNTNPQQSPLFNTLTMACIWAQVEGWV